MTYEPSPVTDIQPEDLPRFVMQELRRIADTINTIVNEGLVFLPTAVSGAIYTVLVSDHSILLDASSNSIAVTLYSAVGHKGKRVNFKRIDTSATYSVTLDGDGSETIDDDLTQALYGKESMTLESDGANWNIL